MRYLLLTLCLTACGFNPGEGQFGPVAVVPEQDSCWINQRVTPTRWEQVRGLCDTKGHDIEVLGLWRY